MAQGQLSNNSLKNSSIPVFTGLDLLFDLKPLFIPLYATLVAVACTGNLLLILLIVVTKKLHSTTNFLIGNLAAADLIMCIFCVPLTASYAFEIRGWLFGVFMCYFVTLMQTATVFVSVLSLTAIAVDRYIVVAYPIRKRLSRKSCVYIVAFIWLLSIVVSVPTSMHTHYLDLNKIGHDMFICEEFWKHQEKERLLYSCSMLLLSYMLPLSAVSISYCAISYRLRKRNVPGAAYHNQEKWTNKKRKTFRVLIISVMCFAVCWLPLQVVNLIRDVDEEFTILDKRYVNVIQVSCHLIAMSSACYNPFIYASLHDKFRFHVSNYFCHHKKRSSVMSRKASRLNTCSTLADIPMGITDKLTLQGRFSFN
ncbi:prolactin-releasing peptide receptor-like [Mauremys reevesii]|uniref:prolactin-releasing peptide receptor-like n=1 Tax=Mauremys reevesii TaxID=260615 RepID=UPI00193F4021|nr:prolactin-releasing peptide receptor-like [Mauremys reevesii]XP_039393270.1 prolactin-releasing peptide receptor-like [Mauremys reevesii]XP_039393271.1 prolactin-releasing peptide receptor-like [Mauremys reevesii]XP_039393272.1 prolactin-releasing peptide receptor-like [Mauremys reevesii]XP_039393273.1 prolactin-releasing peptide receptor-like [Mauremys reevesii]XP_039393274.1 prolactin-releasing peptide receptor-like [Mauremys reevesii]